MEYSLILASCSPRRRELIKLLGLPYKCLSVNTDERSFSKDPSVAVCEISAKKAMAVYNEKGINDGEIIIGADTIVVYENTILGKPQGKDDARKMLELLSAKTHDVFTGVTFLSEKNGKLIQHSFSEKTSVEFDALTAQEIENYLSCGEYADKAGSYAIQGVFSVHIKGIHGDYTNVVGLPVSRIFRELKSYL